MLKEFIIYKLEQIDHFIFVSLFFATVHTLFSPKNRKFFAYLLAFFISVPVGTFAGVLSVDAGAETYMTYLIVSGSALLSQDIIKFLLHMVGYLNKHSESIFAWVIRKITGDRISLVPPSEEDDHNNNKDDKKD